MCSALSCGYAARMSEPVSPGRKLFQNEVYGYASPLDARSTKHEVLASADMVGKIHRSNSTR
jgi:hypothetical protein